MNFLINFFDNTFLITIFWSFVCGFWISYVYINLDSTLSYEKSFALSLIVLTVLTTLIMNAISSSISLSLGLIGALSIVRFRSVLKNTLDMCFIFWCVACGIGFGSDNHYKVGITSVILGLFLISFKLFEKNPLIPFLYKEFIVSINQNNELSIKEIESVFKKNNMRFELKNSTFNKEQNQANLIFSIKCIKTYQDNLLINLQDDFKKINGVEEISIFKPQNEINI